MALELTIRDWMVIIGTLLIVAVLIDAWRRMRADRRGRVRMKLIDVPSEGDADRERDEFGLLHELPNGGARVVARDGDAVSAPEGLAAEPDGGSSEARDADAGPRAAAGADATAVAAGPPPAAASGKMRARSATPSAGGGLFEGLRGDRAEPENLDWLRDLPLADEEGDEDEARLNREDPEAIFVLHVVARDQAGFAGDDILQILLACDLRFGDMNFFHRHEHEAGRGRIQFSVTNMMQPGVFDIDRMGELMTPGLIFFVAMPGPEDMMKAFDYMLETARAVARNLGGDVLDENRSTLTRQTLEHTRQQIRELERRQLARSQ